MYQIYETLRKERGKSVSDIVSETGIARSTLWRWKHGEIKLKVDTLAKLASALNVPITVFFENGVVNDKGI